VPQKAAAAASAVEIILPAAHAANAACITVEVALLWDVIVGDAAVTAEVCSKPTAAPLAVPALRQPLGVVTVIANNLLQVLTGEPVVFLLHSACAGRQTQLTPSSLFCTHWVWVRAG
jgi:hypothetical protein